MKARRVGKDDGSTELPSAENGKEEVLTMKLKAQRSWTDVSKPTNAGPWGLEGCLAGALYDVGVILIMVMTPIISFLVWYTIFHQGGSVGNLCGLLRRKGGVDMIWKSCPSPLNGKAWQIIATFSLLQVFFQVFLPGKTVEGPVTPKGNIPKYVDNGFLSYVLTNALLLSTWKLGLFCPSSVYDLMGEIIAALCLGGFALCILLNLKGRYMPSSSDHGSTGSFILDFYWGLELYPRLGALDIKQFTNCRFGMMSWEVLILCYAIKQYEFYGFLSDSMIVSTTLMTIYNTKFFLWESGYWRSMDIMHDRAGYYLCWGCITWIPAFYTSPVMYLVHHPVHLGGYLASLYLLLGCICIFVNFQADMQRHNFRATHGQTKIWGRTPRKIVASYKTEDGERKRTLLLASGWWGVARHFHYVPEVLGAFFWSAPALWTHLTPYLYVLYLALVLLDRAHRDDRRCSSKYGKHWGQYCRLVPWKMLPGVW